MTTQLRLVDTEALATPTDPGQPGTSDGAPRARSGRRGAPRAVTGRVRRGGASRRPVRWHSEWRLDDRTRRVGQEGVAAARVALARARQADQDLAEAS